MAIAGVLTVNVVARSEDFERGSKRVIVQIQQMQQAATRAQVTYTDMGTSLLRSLTPIAAGVASLAAFKAGLIGVIEAGDNAKRVETTFKALSTSSEQAQAALTLVRGTADRLGVGFDGLAQDYAKLAGATRNTSLEGAATADIFTNLTNATKAIELSSADTSGVILAFTQILSKGKLTAEDLNQVLERVPGGMGLAARAVGVTTAEFLKMRDAGEILASQFIPKFAQQMARELGGSAESTSKTFSAAMERLGNATKDAAALASKSGFVDFLTNVVDKMAAIIKSAPEAQRRMEELAKVQTQRDIAPLTNQGLDISLVQQTQLEAIRQRMVIFKEQIAAIQQPARTALDASLLATYTVKLADLQKQYDELFKTIGQGARDAQSAQEGLGQFGQSRYVAALELQKSIFQKTDELGIALGRAQQRLQLISDPVEKLAALKEQEAQLVQTREAIQSLLARQPLLQPVLEMLPGREVDAIDVMTNKATKLRMTVSSELAGIGDTLGKVRGQILEFSQQGLITDTIAKDYDELVARVKSFSTELADIQDSIVVKTRRFITEYNAQRPTMPMGEATQKLLLEQARRLDQRVEFTKQAKELEDTLTQAYTGYQEAIDLAGVASEAEFERRMDFLRSKTQPFFEAIERQANKGFGVVIASADRMADSVLDAFINMATGSKVAIADMARSIGRELLSIAIQATGAREALTTAIQGGLIGVESFFRGPSFTTTGTAATSLANTEAIIASVPGLASGGPVVPGKIYEVGERGREYFVPRTPGEIVPQAQMPGRFYEVGSSGGNAGSSRGSNGPGGSGSERPVTVVMHLHDVRDASTFKRSEGEVRNLALRAWQAAIRNV